MTVADQGAPGRGARVRRRAADALIVIYGVATLIALAGWLARRLRMPPFVALETAFGLVNVPVAHTLVSAVALGLNTIALSRRKRLGLWGVAFWQLAGAYVGLIEVARLPHWPEIEQWWEARELVIVLDLLSIPLGALLLVVLWWLRSEFPARALAGSWPRALLTLGGGMLLSSGTTWLLLRHAAGLDPHRARMVTLRIVARSFGLTGGGYSGGPAGGTVAAPPLWIGQVSSAMIALTLVLTVLVFLRTARDPHAWSGPTELALRSLVRDSPEADSLAYFATRRDKSAVMSPDGRAAVAYRVLHGVSLSSGDPVGDPASWRAAINAWREEALSYGWVPAVIAASAAGARAYAESGLMVLALGDEAVLDASRFSLAAPVFAEVRQAVRRARASGVEVRIVRQNDLTDEERVLIPRLAHDWRHGGTERGFSMALGRLLDPADASTLFVLASDASGALVGLLGFVPWGRSGASLDLMRRSPDAPNGTTELMVTQVLERGGEVGVHRVSLNFCMFRRVYADAATLGAGTLTRLNHSVLGFLDRFWQLERLYRTNRRYYPQWVPRYVCYQDGVALPRVLFVMGVAEGFLPGFLTARDTRRRQLTAVEAAKATAIATREPAAAPRMRRPSAEERVRREHAAAMEASGMPCYPPAGPAVPDSIASVLRTADWDGTGRPVDVSGRLGRFRDHGGVAFTDLSDGTASVQVIAERDVLTAPVLDALVRWCDRGDLIRVRGIPTRSGTGTRSLRVTGWSMQAKCLRPLAGPDWIEPESRARRRSEDLIAHPGAARVLRTRAAVVHALRGVLDRHGFLEVETPILQTVHGGANARPFVTHLNAYATDVTLRIAPELALKRLVVGGLGPLYEIGRNFRNEGADSTHNPEFTSLEAYLPHADYAVMRKLTEELLRAAAIAASGRPVLPLPSGVVDLAGPIRTVPVLDAVSDAVGMPVRIDTPRSELVALAREHGVAVSDAAGAGVLIERLYGALVECRTTRPTFYVDFPLETSPLARPHRGQPGLAERWDLVISGLELGTAYSELTDPADQRRRLTAQSLLAAGGDPEAMEVDEDFLAALELGMPPCGGLGLGVDRLVMLLTGQPIRGVLALPFVRPSVGVPS